MIGATLFLGEPMRRARWVATLVGFAGVLIVVGPRLSGNGGGYHLIMLASAPMFAASFLITKALTRYESPGVILVWQSITVSLFSLPLALWHWQTLSAWQWLGFLMCGVLGSGGHYCLTRSFMAADISATQSAKFLDLLWSALMGWMVFSEFPSQSTLIGGGVICAATLWVARRESRARDVPFT
jgi:drug/metabolite transporter (DMT)-like permease